MTLIGCVICVNSPASIENFCLCVCYLVWMFLHFFYYQSLLVFVSKIQKHIKSKKSKKFDRHYCVFHKHVMSCTFVLMAMCIYERSLYFMHSLSLWEKSWHLCDCVNRSSNLSWIISQWFCWSWNLHRLVPIYFPTFFFFCLKSSTNVNLKMKRDNEL